jgi:hypothetical protein
MRYVVTALAASLGLVLAAGPAFCQKDENKEDISFKTYDGALIKGSFYPGSKGEKSPTVMMLHPWGSNSSKAGWVALAKRLQEKGYSVMTFDFRGHGLSTTVDPDKFWIYGPNRSEYKGPYKKDLSTIKYTDFKPSYLPYLVNDIMAARQDLDNRNDGNGCNVSNLLVIGAEEGASLGLAWMTEEFFRESINKKKDATVSPFQWKRDTTPERPASEDLAGGIWLSATRYPNKAPGPYAHYMQITRDKLRNVPMWFTYGETDKIGKDDAHNIASALKLDRGELKIKNNTLPIKGTQLRGQGLLGVPNLETEDLIEKFIDQMVKLRPNEARKMRNANEYQPFYAPLGGLGFSGYP